MKKLILFTALFVAVLFATAQQSERIYEIDIDAGAQSARATVPTSSDVSTIIITKTAAIASVDWVIAPDGTENYNQSFDILYKGLPDPGTGPKDITIFGVTLTLNQLGDTVYLKSWYDGTTWNTWLTPSFGNKWIVGANNIHYDAYDSTTLYMDQTTGKAAIIDEGVTVAKMADLTDGKFLIGNISNRPVAVTPTGDITITNNGLTELADDSVTTSKIADEAVTVDKMADLAEGSILQGGSGDRPVALDASTSGNMLIADGTDLASVAISADLNINPAGVATIQANAITGAEITDGVVALNKLVTLTPGQLVIANASGIPAAVTLTGDGAIGATGIFSIAAGVVSATELASDLTPSKFTLDGSVPATQFHGVMAVRTMDEAAFKLLLDGTKNTIFTLADGEVFLKLRVVVQTVGGVGTFDVGLGTADAITYVDDNALIEVGDGNATGFYSTEDATYAGLVADFGYYENTYSQNLYVTITSSTDYTATAIIARVILYYIPNN